MRYIAKRNEPYSLTEHKRKENAHYDNMGSDGSNVKEDIRTGLLEEQGHLCCYCMQRIYRDRMKIEHWMPQSKDPNQQLNYKNMLGACIGNEGKKRYLHTCDTHKCEDQITINPLNRSHIESLKYSDHGKIFSDDTNIDQDLNEILNLNNQSLIKNRKSVLDEIIQYLKKKYGDRQWTKSMIQKEIDRWNKIDHQGRYKEYCEIALYYLRKRYRKSLLP